jgi:hypothetical protein
VTGPLLTGIHRTNTTTHSVTIGLRLRLPGCRFRRQLMIMVRATLSSDRGNAVLAYAAEAIALLFACSVPGPFFRKKDRFRG